MSTASTKPSNTRLLITSVVDGVVAPLSTLIQDGFEGQSALLAEVMGSLAGFSARLEVLELQQSSITPKRQTRGPRKTATTKAIECGGDKEAVEAAQMAKIRNGQHYVRYFWQKDAWRAKYNTEEVAAQLAAIDKVNKFDIVTQTEKYMLAAGGAFWTTIATAAQKKSLSDEFKKWRDDRAVAALEPPLDADVDGAEGGGAADAAAADDA